MYYILLNGHICKMWILIAASALLCSAYSDASRYSKRYVRSGAAGGYAGAGTGLYGDPFAGAGYGAGYGFPSSPDDFPGFVNPYDFQGVFNDYFVSLQKHHAAAASTTYTTDDATASASTSLYPDNLFRQQFEHQQALYNSIRNRAGTTYGSNVPSYASSSVSSGPHGVHHSTYISPPNPASPNINTRYAGSVAPGYYGISTASFSESSDINGQKSSRRGSVAQVNDNGKVTTYQSFS